MQLILFSAFLGSKCNAEGNPAHLFQSALMIIWAVSVTRAMGHQCTSNEPAFNFISHIQGVFFHWYPPKRLKYGKSRLGESTLTYIGLDTPNLAQINF